MDMHRFSGKIALATVFATLSLAVLPAAAQYPTKPVRIIVPMPAGSATDTLTRILSAQLAVSLGQSVMVENKPGADGVIAGELVAKSAPDGYTLFMATNTPLAAAPALHKSMPYDAIADFTPISFVGKFTFFLVVPPTVPAKTLMELVAYARANPGKLNYAAGSSGNMIHAAHFASLGQVNVVHVPYKGEPPAVVDLLSGRVQMMFASPTTVLSHVKEGRLRALAVTLSKRSPLLPQVPTIAEAGMPHFAVAAWAAMFGPAKLPKDVLNRLNREVTMALQRPDVREQMERQAFESSGSTPEQLGAYTKEQIDVWKRVTRELGLKTQ
jgi:tripartite-type tricarboxylate transporter receptor subunit TctC